jgi:hypothetical protein
MGSGITVANMTDTTLNPAVPTKKVIFGTETVIQSEIEIEIPDVDEALDQAFSHLAHHLGEQQAVIDSALNATRGDSICQASLQGYLNALEDVTALMGTVRASH